MACWSLDAMAIDDQWFINEVLDFPWNRGQAARWAGESSGRIVEAPKELEQGWGQTGPRAGQSHRHKGGRCRRPQPSGRTRVGQGEQDRCLAARRIPQSVVERLRAAGN